MYFYWTFTQFEKKMTENSYHTQNSIEVKESFGYLLHISFNILFCLHIKVIIRYYVGNLLFSSKVD